MEERVEVVIIGVEHPYYYTSRVAPLPTVGSRQVVGHLKQWLTFFVFPKLFQPIFENETFRNLPQLAAVQFRF